MARGRPPKVAIPDLIWKQARTLYETQPDVSVPKLIDDIERRTGIRIPHSTLHKRIKSQGWTRQRVAVRDNAGKVHKRALDSIAPAKPKPKRKRRSKPKPKPDKPPESQLPPLPEPDPDKPEEEVLLIPERILNAIQKGIETDQVLAQAAKGSLGWHLKRDFAIRGQIDAIEKTAAAQGRELTAKERAKIVQLKKELIKIPDLVKIAQIGVSPNEQVNLIMQKITNQDNRIQVMFEVTDPAKLEPVSQMEERKEAV